MKNIILLTCVTSIALIFSCKKENTPPEDQIYAPEGYTLVWSDEFNDPAINTEKWKYETGDGTDYGLPVGWGNNEKQIYTSNIENSQIIDDSGNSVLSITAQDDGSGGYTSAKLTTEDFVQYQVRPY